MADDRALTDLAAAVADGGTPDWPSLESAAADERTRALVGRLRSIADIARAHGDVEASTSGGDHSISSHAADLAPPFNWGPLRVVERIGSGRFGDVYRAFDPHLDREVALKLLRHRPRHPMAGDSTLGLDDEDAALVIQEGRLAARVRHPNVVTIYGAQRIGDRTGIWMELVRGHTLEAELADTGPFDAARLAEAGTQLARALAAVHEAGFVHRDVKATNVMRDRGGRVVLGDFGTGREVDDCTGAPTGLVGTPAYLAPEIFTGQPATERSDLYSLGVLLFHLATGAYPARGRTLAEMARAHATLPRSSVRETGARLPETLAALIDRLIHPDPAVRPASAAAVADALGAWQRGSSSGEARRPSPSLRLAVAATLSVAAAIGFLGWRDGWFIRGPLPAEDRSWVLVVPFENRSGDPLLDGTLESAFERELANSTFVNVMPRDRVEDSLRLMRRPLDTRLDEASAREVALRDGAIGAIVSGAVDNDGAGYRIAARLIDPSAGGSLATLSDLAEDRHDVLPLVRRQVLLMREALGEPRSLLASSQQLLERVTTPSLRALQLYTQAAAELDADRPAAAAELAEMATEEDPSFASAFALRAMAAVAADAIRRLAEGRVTERPEEYLPFAEQALRLAETAAPAEQVFIAAYVHDLRGGTKVPAVNLAEKALAAPLYEAVLAIEPEHRWAGWRLRNVYLALGRLREADDLQVERAELRPAAFEINAQAAQVLLRRGETDRAREFNERAAAVLSPDDVRNDPRRQLGFASVSVRLFEANAAWLEQDAAGALEVVDALAASAGREIVSEERSALATALTRSYLALGRFKDAERAAATAGTANSRNYLRALVMATQGNGAGLRELLMTEYLVSGSDTGRRDLARANYLIEAGLFDEAEREIEEVRRSRNATGTAPGPTPPKLLIARGRSNEAIALIEPQLAHAIPANYYCENRFPMLLVLAEAWEATGDIERAVDVLASGFSNRAEAAIDMVTGRSCGHWWIEARARLARLFRFIGRAQEAVPLEAEVRRLLAVADPGHPLLR